MALGEKKFLRRKENNHVFFVNHHFFASLGNYYHRCTKQYASGFQVFHLEFSAIYYSSDFLFLSHWWSNCGGFGFTKAGEEIPSWQKHEQRDSEIEGKYYRVGENTCWRVSEQLKRTMTCSLQIY
jgi:hypothetical protein